MVPTKWYQLNRVVRVMLSQFLKQFSEMIRNKPPDKRQFSLDGTEWYPVGLAELPKLLAANRQRRKQYYRN